MTHDQIICHECVYLNICDGKQQLNCKTMNRHEFKKIVDDKVQYLEDEFKKINDTVKHKQDAFVALIRKNPKKEFQDEIKHFHSLVEKIDLESYSWLQSGFSFSDNMKNVTRCSPSTIKIKEKGLSGHCFINCDNRSESRNNLKWTLIIPPFGNGYIGNV